MPRTDAQLKALAEAAAVAAGAPPRAIKGEFPRMLQTIANMRLIGGAADRYATAFGKKEGNLYRPIQPGELRDIAEAVAIKIKPKALRNEKFWKKIENAESDAKRQGFSPKKTRSYISSTAYYAATAQLPPDVYPDKTLREDFLKGVRSIYPGAEMTLEVREAAYQTIVKVREQGDKERSVRATMSFAGHNWAYSKQRSEEAAARQAAFMAERQAEQAATVARTTALDAAAIPELKRILHVLRTSPSATPARLNALRYFEQIYLHGKRVPELREMFPGVNRDLAYKWKERTLDAVMALASPRLREWLDAESPTKTRKVR